MAAVAAFIPAALAVYGTVLSYRAAKEQAQREKLNADFESRQYEVESGQKQAASQRVAYDERRMADYAESKATAAAAASGAGTGGTVTDIISRIAQEGAYRSSVALYEGSEDARHLKLRATGRTIVGDQRSDAYDTQAKISLLNGASSLFGKYGGGFPGSVVSSGGTNGGASTLDAGSGGMDNLA